MIFFALNTFLRWHFSHLNDGLLAPLALLLSDAGQHRESHVGVVLDGEDLVALVQDLNAEKEKRD